MSIRPENGYSFSCVSAGASSVLEFEVDRGFDGLAEDDRLDVIIPDPTPAQRRKFSLPRRGDRAGDNEYKYRDTFWPLMNVLWPVELADERSPEDAARLMNRHAPSTTLMRIDDSHFICLTGGGMDLSWQIAAAYVCCGCVPPFAILTRLRHAGPASTSPTIRRAILTAGRQGAAFMRASAKRLAGDIRMLSKSGE